MPVKYPVTTVYWIAQNLAYRVGRERLAKLPCESMCVAQPRHIRKILDNEIHVKNVPYNFRCHRIQCKLRAFSEFVPKRWNCGDHPLSEPLRLLFPAVCDDCSDQQHQADAVQNDNDPVHHSA